MISALGAFPRRLEAVSSSTCAMAASSLYAGSTALTAVDSATWDASASSCALAISYGPLIRFCGGVHGANRSMTTIPVSSTLAATAPTPIRGQRWRHHRAASAPSTSATPRYQYASSFVLSQSQLWNTTTLHAANTSMPARKSSSRGAGTSPRARVAIAPTRPGIHRQAATITATTESGTATPTLTIQNPHHSGATSWRNAWPTARNAPPAEMSILPDALASQPGSNHGYALPAAADPCGATATWTRRGAASTADTASSASHPRRECRSASTSSTRASAMNVWMCTSGSSPSNPPATANVDHAFPGSRHAATTRIRVTSAVAKPYAMVRCGSHQASSGVYHCMSGNGAGPPSDGSPS